MNPTPSHYHIVLRVLHWLMAVMMIGVLTMGTLSLANMPNSDPHKVDALRMHMIGGMTLGALMLVRLITRVTTAKPAPADTGNALLNKAGKATHWLLYLLMFGMVGSGMAISLLAGLPDVIFGGNDQLPVDFSNLPPRAAHGIMAKLLIAFIALHIIAALYHQFVRKDGLLSRMWFGRSS